MKDKNLAQELERFGYKVFVFMNRASLEEKLKLAKEAGCKFAALIGSKEIAEKMVILKNLMTGKEKRVYQETIGERVKSLENNSAG